MTTITQAEYTAILTKCAKNDLASARRDVKRRANGVGTLIVCDTKLGNVEIFFNSHLKTYTVTGFNNGVTHLIGVKAARVIAFLVANYKITMQDTVVV